MAIYNPWLLAVVGAMLAYVLGVYAVRMLDRFAPSAGARVHTVIRHLTFWRRQSAPTPTESPTTVTGEHRTSERTQVERQVLEWFRQLGPMGVSSNKSDLSAATSRLQSELALTPKFAAGVLTSLRSKGLIETDNRVRWYEYRTTISDAGIRVLETAEATKTQPLPERRPNMRGKFGQLQSDPTGYFLLGSFTNVGSVNAKEFRADFPRIGRRSRSEIPVGASFDVKCAHLNPQLGSGESPLVAAVEYSDGETKYRQEGVVDMSPTAGSNIRNYRVESYAEPFIIDDFMIPY